MTTRHCHDCGREMLLRVNRKTRTEFLSCSGWEERDALGNPRCTRTEPLPASEYMRRAGAALLPGFDETEGGVERGRP